MQHPIFGVYLVLGPYYFSEEFFMRKANQLITVALVALVVLLMGSCTSRGGNRTGSWVADEAEIRSLMQSSMESWNRGDLTGHLALYDQNVTFMTKNGPRPGVAAIEELFKKTYFQDGHPIQSLRFEQLAVRPLARDAGAPREGHGELREMPRASAPSRPRRRLSTQSRIGPA